MAYTQQRSYADNRRRDLEFEEGDKVYLKISPIKEVVRFVNKWKLSPCYVGPYEIVQRVGKVAYELKLGIGFGSSGFPCFYVEKLCR